MARTRKRRRKPKPPLFPNGHPIHKIEKSLRREILHECQQGRCFYCLALFAEPLQSSVTLDHVVPKSVGGHTSITNLVAACEQCNVQKSDYIIDGGWVTDRLQMFLQEIDPAVDSVLDCGFRPPSLERLQ